MDNVHTFESTLDIAKRSRVYGFLKRVNKGVLNTDKAKEPSCGKTYCSMPQSLRFFHFTSKRENPFPKICIIVAILQWLMFLLPRHRIPQRASSTCLSVSEASTHVIPSPLTFFCSFTEKVLMHSLMGNSGEARTSLLSLTGLSNQKCRLSSSQRTMPTPPGAWRNSGR